MLHRVGDGEDIVAQLAIGDAAFWVSTAGSAGQRIHPKAIGGATSRTLLIVDDPEAVFHHAVTAGATPTAPPANEHGWWLARITDPFGHQWEIGRPLGTWPPPHHPNHHQQLAYASAGSRSSACRSPGSAPPADGGASAFIAEQIGESGTSSSQGL